MSTHEGGQPWATTAGRPRHRVQIWRAANGPGWIGHWKLHTQEFGWLGVGQIWDANWRGCLDRSLTYLREVAERGKPESLP